MGVRSGRLSGIMPCGRTNHQNSNSSNTTNSNHVKLSGVEPSPKTHIRQRFWSKVHHHHQQQQQQQQTLSEPSCSVNNPKFSIREKEEKQQHYDVDTIMNIAPPPPGVRVLDEDDVTDDENDDVIFNSNNNNASTSTSNKNNNNNTSQSRDAESMTLVEFSAQATAKAAAIRTRSIERPSFSRSTSVSAPQHEQQRGYHVSHQQHSQRQHSQQQCPQQSQQQHQQQNPSHPSEEQKQKQKHNMLPGMNCMPQPLSHLIQFEQHNPAESNSHIALFEAVRSEDIERVQKLLSKSNASCSMLINDPLRGNNSSALYEACNRGHLGVTQALLEAGAPPDVGTIWGGTPLLIAAQQGRTTIARLLLRAGANPGLASTDGATPLILAARWGKVAVCRLLVAAGADYGSTDVYRHTAVNAARDSSQTKVLKWMERTKYFTALHHACEMVDPDRVLDILRSDVVLGECLVQQRNQQNNHQYQSQGYIERQQQHPPIPTPMECALFSPLKSTKKRPADLTRLVSDLRAGGGSYSPTTHRCFPKGFRDVIHVLLKYKVVLNMRQNQHKKQKHKKTLSPAPGFLCASSKSQAVEYVGVKSHWTTRRNWQEVLLRLVNVQSCDLLMEVIGYCERDWFVGSGATPILAASA